MKEEWALAFKNYTIYLRNRCVSYSVINAEGDTTGEHQRHRLLWEGVGFLATRVHWEEANTYYVVQSRTTGPPMVYLCLRRPWGGSLPSLAHLHCSVLRPWLNAVEFGGVDSESDSE